MPRMPGVWCRVRVSGAACSWPSRPAPSRPVRAGRPTLRCASVRQVACGAGLHPVGDCSVSATGWRRWRAKEPQRAPAPAHSPMSANPSAHDNPTRTFALWCPAWAVATARCADPTLAGLPVAVVERGKRGLVVRAASTEARTEGVTVGLRRREAESRCAGLVVVDADPAAEARTFEVVARAMDPITPGVVLERPGVLTFPTRGPSRYFGGDDALAVRVL